MSRYAVQMPRFPGQRDFEAREDLSTLTRADDVRRDRKRLTRARAMAKKELRSAETTVKRVSARSLGSRR